MDPTTVANQIVPTATALAGLILVFLGGVFTSYNSYDAQQQATVKGKYQIRGIVALAGFVGSLLSAVFGFLSNWWCATAFVYAAIFALGVSFILIVILAVMAVSDLF